MIAGANSLPGGWLESGHGSISIYVKDFRDPLERKKKLILRPWASIKDIKDQLQVIFNVPSNVQKLYFHGRELKNAHNLQECGIYQDNVVIDFVARRANNLAFFYGTDEGDAAPPSATNTNSSDTPTLTRRSSATNANGANINANTKSPARAPNLPRAATTSVNILPYGAHLLPVTLMKVMHQALQGLALGLAPVLAMDGTGGTYFLKDPTHRNVGCFKPQDEEPLAPNNPRGLVGELGQSGLRRGILAGEACERELAAYIMDRDHFAGVPATSLVEARHPVFKYKEFSSVPFKMGSLQEFVRHDDVASDLAPSQFSAHQVHKIVLLDMRLLNTDRNDANILVRKRRSATTPSQVEYELIPIDHGYCLPQFLEIAWCDWCWYNWPQLQEPLSKEDRAYVLGLNVAEDADRLARKIPLRRACRRNMVIAGTLIQRGVKAGLVLYALARIMCRDDMDAPSPLERMCLDAFHTLRQKKEGVNGTTAATTSASTAAPVKTGSAKFSNLRISTELPAENEGAKANSGAASPPGFWASFTPFSMKPFNWADDSENEEEEEDEEEEAEANASPPPVNGPTPTHSRPSNFVAWDTIAANALSHAAGDTAKPKDDDCASVVSTTFAEDKDEFEALNETLDANVQDEKLFLSVLWRLIDDKIAECLATKQNPAAPTPTRRSSRG